MSALLVLLHLLVLHRLDGTAVEVNVDFITSLGEARDENKLTHARVHCIIGLVDGSKITVEEDCGSVKQRMLPVGGKPP